MMKKTIALLTASVLLLTVLVTACDQTAEGPAETNRLEQDSAAPPGSSDPAAIVDTPPSAAPTSDQNTDDKTGTPDVTPAQGTEPTPTVQPVADPTPDRQTAAAEDARAFIGESASSMIAAIGEPISSSYAPSCMGDGDDGELIYDGFTVYTYREGGVETVQDVL